MVDLIPVDHDPFAPPSLIPVDHDPFDPEAAVGPSAAELYRVMGKPMPPSGEEAARNLWGMTGIPDIQAGAEAFGRGEPLQGVGQMGAGLASLATLGAPIARGAATLGREAIGAVPSMLADTTGAIKPSSLWYHGGQEAFNVAKAGSEVYMTSDPAQALQYARGVHLGGYGSGEPRITAISPKSGKIMNVDDILFDAMDNGDDLQDALNAAFPMARQEGARYVEYTHPNAGAQGEHTVRVSLYPQEDLGVGAIKAFHGSPYDFDRFDMSKIGTGEGAQAYGHGLYFAESEPVAWTYRYLNAPVGQGTGAASFARQAESAASNAGLTGDEARTYAIDLLNKKAMEQHPTARQTWYDAANNYDALIGAKEPPGRMYEARINADPEHFLDWDKPLSQQSEKVQEALRNEPFASLIKANMDKGTQTRAQYGLPGSGEMMPENLYNILRGYVNAGGSSLNIPGGDMASRSLREAGIPGIRYLDQGSRGAGEGTHNYVVFDDKLIDIIKKYGLAGLVAGGAATIGGGTAGATHLIPVEHDPFDTASLGPSGTGRPLPPPQMPAVPEDKGRPRQDRDHDYKPTQFGSMFDILQAAGVR